MAFTYYKTEEFDIIHFYLKICFMIYVETSLWKKKKKNTRFKAFREEEKVLAIQLKLCTDNFVREAIWWKQNARQLRWYRVGWLLVGLNLGFPLMISLRTTWARCELVVCQQKREGASLVFRMLKYYEKVNVSKEIHQSTARQARNKLYVKFRNTHY